MRLPLESSSRAGGYQHPVLLVKKDASNEANDFGPERFRDQTGKFPLEHNPEKWTPLFRKHHAPSKSWSEMTI
jgi:hypothetical protein